MMVAYLSIMVFHICYVPCDWTESGSFVETIVALVVGSIGTFVVGRQETVLRLVERQAYIQTAKEEWADSCRVEGHSLM